MATSRTPLCLNKIGHGSDSGASQEPAFDPDVKYVDRLGCDTFGQFGVRQSRIVISHAGIGIGFRLQTGDASARTNPINQPGQHAKKFTKLLASNPRRYVNAVLHGIHELSKPGIATARQRTARQAEGVAIDRNAACLLIEAIEVRKSYADEIEPAVVPSPVSWPVDATVPGEAVQAGNEPGQLLPAGRK